ncbi:MAG: hypothetical protein EOO13_00035 [Chitinophagaceae bacterium]|nr:MAG: hypothetical protein EOO13_00035 [Chitinophagaceae bacterium]
MEPEQAAALIYSSFYYESLRDESSDAQLTIIVAALICNEVQSNKTVTVNGFITKRMVNNVSRIDIQLTVTDVVEQTAACWCLNYRSLSGSRLIKFKR